LREIITLEKKRFIEGFCQGVRKTIFEIEFRTAATLSEVRPGLTSSVGLFLGNGFEGEPGKSEKLIPLPAATVAGLRFDNDGIFDQCCYRHTADSRVANGAGVALGIRLGKKYGEDCGGVDDHLGRPLSS